MQIPYNELHEITLSVIGDAEHEKNGYACVLTKDLFKESVPHIGGVYDSHMGTFDKGWLCGTCSNDTDDCPGHPGIVKLNYPTYSPLFVKHIQKWLKSICHTCGKLIIGPREIGGPKLKRLAEYAKYRRQQSSTGTKRLLCFYCKAPNPHISKEKSDNITITVEFYKSAVTDRVAEIEKRENLYPHHVLKIFEKVTDETVRLIGQKIHPRTFVLNTIQAPPNTIRPDMKKSGGQINDITQLLQNIVKANNAMPVTIPFELDRTYIEKLKYLNICYFEMIKGSSGTKSKLHKGSSQTTSIAKRLPGKTGRIRRNLNGRRVGKMARSFISGDPTLQIDQIGVPISIAKDIQFPEIVRPYNIDRLKIYFANKRNAYPGCTQIKKTNGKTYSVAAMPEHVQLEFGDEIFRDTIDGDIVNFNRQPSLESSSIAAYRVKIMEFGLTIRMNVMACSLHAADFDGDAMNIIFAQKNRVLNEIKNLSQVAGFFISYKTSAPKIGQMHDGMIGSYLITKDHVAYDKFRAMRLFANTTLFPEFGSATTYTGRDIISQMLKTSNYLINFATRAGIYDANHAPFRRYSPSEIEVSIKHGVLTSGVLDKASVGTSQGNVFHIIHNQYGAKHGLLAAFNIQQLAIGHIYHRGFTMNMDDFTVKRTAVNKIQEHISSLIVASQQVARSLIDGKIIAPIGKTVSQYYEILQMNTLNPSDAPYNFILEGINPEINNLYSAVMCGSRGSKENFRTITYGLVQQEINGERIAENFNGRSTPYYTKDSIHPESRGFIPDSYTTGLNPASYMSGAQNGRYALIQTAISTAVVGDFGRRSIKNLESNTTDNRRSVRKGNRITQYLYGDDGIDARALEYVKIPAFVPSLTDADFKERYHVGPAQMAKLKNMTQKLADEEFKELVTARNQHRKIFMNIEALQSTPISEKLSLPVNVTRIVSDAVHNLNLKAGDPGFKTFDPVAAMEAIKQCFEELDRKLVNPSISHIPPHFRGRNELLKMSIRTHLCLRELIKHGINNAALEIIIKNIVTTYARALITYGKSVGILAAQAVSEPTTQLVISSHHTIGISSTKKKGMFRIREIFGAKPTENMLGPSMVFRVIPEFRSDKSKVKEIASAIELLTLKDFVANISVFYEDYGKPTHPEFIHEKDIIREYEKYNKHIRPPTDLTNWCIRIEVDKFKLVLKNMTIETIYTRLTDSAGNLFIVYNSDNSEKVIMRIYVRNIQTQKSESVTSAESANKLIRKLLNMPMRGIEGITAANVQEQSISTIQEDGSIKMETIFNIITEGSNLRAILENPYVDTRTVISDSIKEMEEIFGIVCARNRIIAELRYQVSVPTYRHLTVFADEMTQTGVFTSIDRYGSAKRHSNFMQKISDASPVAIIEDAALSRATTRIEGVSTPIMIGKNPEIGDLYNTFTIDVDYISQQKKQLDDIFKSF